MAHPAVKMSLDEFRKYLNKLSVQARHVERYISNPKKNQPISDKLPDGIILTANGRRKKSAFRRS